ncbi:hypothetical protein ACPOL_4118 [Acidisarcina polymorpha]|uniref:BON domain-containing protein n=2 Tax=Acidisarcina polymorpha TaxID=2211140 RepID=A0A2Z5G419_9BACT|nr:BON domain-containing protein [Acidisarcina polymorpha]AXC13395.1 hypothetical protein ACPOL_4118 [Acidisarcina polymorpha]
MMVVSKIQGVRGVRDEIEVAAPSIPDRKLKAELDEAIIRTAYERLGRPSKAPTGICVHVHSGVVTLSGYIADPGLAMAAHAVSASTVGVKSLHDKIEVSPDASLMTEWTSRADSSTGLSSVP